MFEARRAHQRSTARPRSHPLRYGPPLQPKCWGLHGVRSHLPLAPKPVHMGYGVESRVGCTRDPACRPPRANPKLRILETESGGPVTKPGDGSIIIGAWHSRLGHAPGVADGYRRANGAAGRGGTAPTPADRARTAPRPATSTGPPLLMCRCPISAARRRPTPMNRRSAPSSRYAHSLASLNDSELMHGLNSHGGSRASATASPP